MAAPISPEPVPPSSAVVDAEPAYQPKDAIAASLNSGSLSGGAGLLLAAVQNTLARENVGAFGVFTRFGGTVALFGMLESREGVLLRL